MKVLFIGSVAFSEEALKKLVQLDVDLAGIVTKSNSSFNSDFVDLSGLAKEYGIDYYYAKNINDPESIEWIRDKKPEVIFCLGWSQLLKEDILNIPSKGVIGYHPTKLPYNRGRHPLIWAIVLGLKETASTFFLMDKGADTGDIISQKTFPIYYEDEAIDVYKRMCKTAVGQLKEIVAQFNLDKIQKVSQDPKEGNYWRKRNKEDGKIDFRMSSENIYNLIRALSTPYVGAHIEYKDNEIKVWESEPAACDLKNIEPGKILDVDKYDNRFLVKTGDSAIWITEHEMENSPNKGDYL